MPLLPLTHTNGRHSTIRRTKRIDIKEPGQDWHQRPLPLLLPLVCQASGFLPKNTFWYLRGDGNRDLLPLVRMNKSIE